MTAGRIALPKRPRQNGTGIANGDQVRFLANQTAVSEELKHAARVMCNRHASSDVECREFYRMLGVVPGVVA